MARVWKELGKTELSPTQIGRLFDGDPEMLAIFDRTYLPLLHARLMALLPGRLRNRDMPMLDWHQMAAVCNDAAAQFRAQLAKGRKKDRGTRKELEKSLRAYIVGACMKAAVRKAGREVDLKMASFDPVFIADVIPDEIGEIMELTNAANLFAEKLRTEMSALDKPREQRFVRLAMAVYPGLDGLLDGSGWSAEASPGAISKQDALRKLRGAGEPNVTESQLDTALRWFHLKCRNWTDDLMALLGEVLTDSQRAFLERIRSMDA